MKMAESSSASASASAAAGSNVLDLELAGVDSGSSFDDQETTDERETSQTSETTSEATQASSSKVVSLLDGLRAPKKSELTRKRKIFTNPPCQYKLHHEFVAEFLSIIGHFCKHNNRKT